MKLVREVLWIIFFTFVGELLNKLLPLPVPSGVYGLILMLVFLMRIMFLPASVGIMTVSKILMPVLLPYLVIIFFSTFIVMSVTGLCAEWILSKTETAEDKEILRASIQEAEEKKEKREEELRELLLQDTENGLQDLEEGK